MPDLKLTTVLLTALIDSINPCAIGVLILLISTLLVLSKDKKKLLKIGAIYVGANDCTRRYCANVDIIGILW